MTTLDMLWLPIIVSSVFVFIVSALINMLPLWHKNDFPAVPRQDDVMNALKTFDIPAGEYMLPRSSSMAEMKTPEFAEKLKNGPVMIMTVWKDATLSMTKPLVLWFINSLVVGIFAAYVAGRALPVGTEYLHVFRFAGVTSFLAYSAALWQTAIWYHRPWKKVLMSTLDGLIYGLVTAGAFGWLWPA